MLSRTNAGTGIVLGHHSVKLVRVESGRQERPRLTHWGVQDVESGTGPAGEVHARAVGMLLKGLKLKPRHLGRVATAISGRDVYLRQVTMPRLSDEELRQALPFEAKKHFPLDSLANPVLDFQILGPTPPGNGNGNGGQGPGDKTAGTELQEVLLVAAPKRRRDEALKALAAAGIDPETVDAEPLPTINAVLDAHEDAGDPVILIGLGAEVSFLAAVDADGGLYTRHLSFSGEALTKCIEEKLNFDRAAAEAMKRDLSGPESEQVTALLEEPIRDLVGEIGETVRFLAVRRRSSEPGRFYLTGGASLTAGLADELERGLRAKMTFADPFMGVVVSPEAAIGEADKVRLAGAVGLACGWGQGEV